MQYFLVQNSPAGTVRDIKNCRFPDLEAAQRLAASTVADLICDALLLGKAPEDISVEIWEESGPVVCIFQGSGPD